MDVQTKKDITRLKNLLKNYRDHIITNNANKKLNLTDTIKYTDEAINFLIGGL